MFCIPLCYRLVDVEHADALHLKKALNTLYQEYIGKETEDPENPRPVEPTFSTKAGLIGAGADGASVNFGVHRGMITQIRNDVPWLVGVHCIAHRLELAVKDALKDSFLTKEV